MFQVDKLTFQNVKKEPFLQQSYSQPSTFKPNIVQKWRFSENKQIRLDSQIRG